MSFKSHMDAIAAAFGIVLISALIFLLMVGEFLAFTMFLGTIVIIVRKSIYMLSEDTGVESILFAKHRYTYLSGAFMATVRDDNRVMSIINNDSTYRNGGMWGTNIVFLLWPIWRPKVFPTRSLLFQLHFNRLFTEDSQESSRVALEMDIEIHIQFFTIRNLVSVFDDLQHADLAKKCSTMGSDKDHEYTESRLAKALFNTVNKQAAEAVIKAVSHCRWRGDRDIARNTTRIELHVLHKLAAKGGDLAKTKTLTQVGSEDPEWDELDDYHFHDFYGDTIVSLSMNMKGFNFIQEKPEDSEAMRAINKPYIAETEKIARIRKGEAEAEVIRQKGAATAQATDDLRKVLNQEGGDVAAVTNAIAQNKSKIELTQIGGTLEDLARSLVKQYSDKQSD